MVGRDLAVSTVFVIVASLTTLSDASHFRGGLVSWRTVGPFNRTSSVTVEITQRYAWRASSQSCYDSTIGSQALVGDSGDFNCQVGCSGSLGSVQVYCTDYSAIGDWMVGERTYTVTVPYAPLIEASYSGGNWISSLVIGADGYWEVRAKFNFNATLARRNNNASPKTKMSPFINLLYGCNHTITIPVEDEDGDEVRCRWAASGLGECASVCAAFPNAVLNERECTITYSAIYQTGLFAVAIQIEDYYSPLDTTPFSSSPLQFLVNIYQSSDKNASCYSKPSFTWSTRRDGVCVGIPLNSTFEESIVAQSGGPGVTIVDISTQSPVGLRKSALGRGPGPNQWHINITWTPADSQVGNNIFCFIAVDNTGANSDQRCVSFAVGTYPPTVRPGSLNPNGSVLPDNSLWQLDFDRSFIRPTRSAYIRFNDESGLEIFKLDVATNPSVTFPDSSDTTTLSFPTRYTFTEKASYYITIDNGIVLGLESCGPESVGMSNPLWWRITIRDVTPPALVSLDRPQYSNGTTTITWSFDEPAQSACVIQSPTSSYAEPCNDSLSLSNLTEGYYTLFVQATDASGNSREYRTSWYVDLTPPSSLIPFKPPTVTNRTSATFTLSCTDLSTCQTYCAIQNRTALGQPVYQSCAQTYTVSSLADGDYVLYVYSVDAVGNIGSVISYTWTVDTIPPSITSIRNELVQCGRSYDTSTLGIPTVIDNSDPLPSLTHVDKAETNCTTLRVWIAKDQAGNTAQFVQTISFTNNVPPTIGATPELYVPCGETATLTSNMDYLVRALNISSVCGRKIAVNYTDSRPLDTCGISLTRQWTVSDDCGGRSYFTQMLRILSPSSPDFPEDGDTDVDLRQALGWPTYPGSIGFNVYIWMYGSSQPLIPTASVPSWNRQYTNRDPFPPNTRILWRIGYNVSIANGTTEIPGPLWGFWTRSYADLSLISFSVPQTAFSGTSFVVTWTVENVGNVSTVVSTGYFYDVVYLSRSTSFADQYASVQVRQERYVDPRDGYVSTGSVQLRPSDLGKIYVFVVVDAYRYVRDYSFDNNTLPTPQAVQVQLTPPPNIKVISVTPAGSLLSGQAIGLKFVVENVGLGITVASGWYDGVYLSKDDTLTPDDRLLLTVYHSGALATRSQYTVTVSVDVPNAVYDDYHVIARTDIYNDVYEHNDEGDNDFALAVSIILSPYPDLVVMNVTGPPVAYTGDVVRLLATVRNSGVGPPFENSWHDDLAITSVSSNVLYHHEARMFGNGPQFAPGTTYSAVFSYTVPPSMPSGEYQVSVTTDYLRQVFEYKSDDNNNMSSVITIIQLLPDLTAGDSSLSVLSNTTGNYLLCNVTVINDGAGDVQVPFWENRLVFVTNLGTFAVDGLVSYASMLRNKSLDISTPPIYIPVRLFGQVDVYISIDVNNKVVETNRTNNYFLLGSVLTDKRQTDLVVKSLTGPERTKAGSVILIGWRVQNSGNLASGKWLSWYDEITLSFGTSYTVLLGRVLITFTDYFQPNDIYYRQANVTVPIDLAGVHKLHLTTGIYVNGGEGQEVNTTNSRKEVTLSVTTPPSPDFRLQSCNSEIHSVGNVRLLTVTCTMKNVGNTMDAPATWTDHLSIVDAAGRPLVAADVSTTRKLPSGEVYTASVTFVITPAIEGYYSRIAFQPDIFSNASRISTPAIVPTPVFIPVGPSTALSMACQPLKASMFTSGAVIEVNCTITNNGDLGLPMSTWTDGLYLMYGAGATKLQVTLQGRLLNSVIQNLQLDVGAHYDLTFKGKLPYLIDGEFYLYIITDINGRLTVRDDGLAAYLNSSIRVEQGPLPDLVASVDSNGTLSVQSGDLVDVTFSVTNVGNSTASGMWYDTVYLSQDTFLDPFDIPLKAVPRLRELFGGESYLQATAVSVPYDLPGTSYYFVVVANVRRDCVELTYENNANSRRVVVVVLPAIDLVVLNVTSTKLNVTYLEDVTFKWVVANNGSLSTAGRKCDSVYLSKDDAWDISDIAIVDSSCGYFKFERKGDSSDSASYSALAAIPPVAAGKYKAVVRTRSNVRDYDLTNNIGAGEASMFVNPPTISLNENKTFTMRTLSYSSFQLIGIPIGIGITVSLTTRYQLAYHRLYLKLNSPPATNSYDVASKGLDTTRQMISVSYTKLGTYYLLVESASAIAGVSYQVSVLVKEAKFEISDVYPPEILSNATVTLRISGVLFGQKMQAYLLNDTVQIAAIKVYRYVSEEAYATFDTTSLYGAYSLRLRDLVRGEYAEIGNAVTVRNSLLPGQLRMNLVTPGALRPGRSAVIQVKLDNVGYSDLSSPAFLLQTGGNSKLISTEADAGTAPVQYLMFSPVERNRPSDVILPKSSLVFSFQAIPNDAMFVGREELYLEVLDDAQLLQLIANFKPYLKPHILSSDAWNVIWRQVDRCFGDQPSTLFNTIGGHFAQHYASLYTLPDVIAHVVEIADGRVPRMPLAAFVDLADEIFNGFIPCRIDRNYMQQLSVRKTSGPFGRGWSAPVLELEAHVAGTSVRLLRERQEYIFQNSDDEAIYRNSRLPEDQITVNKTDIIYRSKDVVHSFDIRTGKLKRIADIRGFESLTVGYNVDNQPVNLTHSNGIAINIDYGSNGYVSSVHLHRGDVQLSQVYYSYSDSGLLSSLSCPQSITLYEYTDDGDLTVIRESDGVITVFSYDENQLLASASKYTNTGNLLQSVQTVRRCDGSVDVTLLPINVTSSYVYGFGGESLRDTPGVGLPVVYKRDSNAGKLELAVGDDVKLSQIFDRKRNTMISTNANSEEIALRLDQDGHIASIGDNLSPYYDGKYENGFLTQISFRDGTQTKLAYDGNGLASSITRRDGSAILYEYDSSKRLRQLQTPDGINLYTYDGDGLLSEVTGSNGKTTRIRYSPRKQPTSVEYPDGTRIDYTYNACGRVSSIITNNGYNSTYIYDDICRLEKIVDGSEILLASFQYTNNSMLSKRELGNGMRTEYTYDENTLRLKKLKNFSPDNTLLSSYEYIYDVWGRRVRTVTQEGNWTYLYDGTGQLIEWTSPVGSVWERLEYDSSHNRQTKQTSKSKAMYYANSMDQYTQYGNTQNFTYDKNGNLIMKYVLINGAVATEQYSYNADGRLSRIVVGRTVCEYRYSVFGTLSNKACSDGTNITYTTDPFGVFGGNILIQSNGNSREFAYHALEIGLIGTVQPDDPSTSRFFLFDGDGSTVHVGDGTGQVRSQYSYDPFGVVLSKSGDRDSNLYKFMAQYGVQTVNETGNTTFMRNRLYNAEHGRFLSPDPLGVYASPTNPYCYANNNPLTYKDPTGRLPIPVIILGGTLVGAAFGGFDYIMSIAMSPNEKEKFSYGGLVKATAGGALAGATTTGIGVLTGGAGLGLVAGSFVTVQYGVIAELYNKIIKGDFNTKPISTNMVELTVAAALSVTKADKIPGLKSILLDGTLGFIVPKVAVCLLLEREECKKDILRWITSRDPNEISVTPNGYGDARFVPSDFLIYKIEFENAANATAPARQVTIRCPMHPGFNPSTFRIGTFAFDTFKLDAGYNSFSYRDVIDARSKYGVFVKVEGQLDVINSEIRWTFKAIDPDTGDEPKDASVGFLQPNNGTSGQGYVTFSVSAHESTTTMTEILANATIQFDNNLPIDTPPIFNTLDKTAPRIQMNTSVVSGGVLVQFSVSDEGSGMKSIDLYRVENGRHILLKSGISHPAMVINLEANREQSLEAVVFDNVDNNGTSNRLSVQVNAECPGNCSGQGVCTVAGICLCDEGYAGENCSVNGTSFCEPPVIALSYRNSTQNESIVVFLSATTARPDANGTLLMLVRCDPVQTGLSRGRIVGDGVQLTESDFGDVLLIPPESFSGWLRCNLTATLADDCGQTNRTAVLSLFVMPIFEATTLHQFTTSDSFNDSADVPIRTQTSSGGAQPTVDPGVAEAIEGALLTLSSNDTAQIMMNLEILRLWVVEAVNRYCSNKTSMCCIDIFGTFTVSLVQHSGYFTSIDLVSLNIRSSQLDQNTVTLTFKVIVRVNKGVVRPQCLADKTNRKRRQSVNLANLSGSIIASAIRLYQRDIEQNLTVNIQNVVSADVLVTSIETSGPADVTGITHPSPVTGSAATDITPSSPVTGSAANGITNPSPDTGSAATGITRPSPVTGSAANGITNPSHVTGTAATGTAVYIHSPTMNSSSTLPSTSTETPGIVGIVVGSVVGGVCLVLMVIIMVLVQKKNALTSTAAAGMGFPQRPAVSAKVRSAPSPLACRHCYHVGAQPRFLAPTYYPVTFAGRVAVRQSPPTPVLRINNGNYGHITAINSCTCACHPQQLPVSYQYR